MTLSTGQRLTMAVAVAILLVSLTGLTAQYLLVKRDLAARLSALVQADLDGFAALYDQRRIIAVRQAIEFRKLTDPQGDLLAILLDRDGAPLAATADAWPASMAQPPEGQTTAPRQFTRDGQRYLGTARTLTGGFPLLVARSTAPTDQTLTVLRRIIAAAVAGIAAISLLVGHLASRWIMARVGRINALADRVGQGDLSARLPGPRGRDEFGLLETHIHAMLDRIEALNRATHHLSDTVAHELRTPLTRIQTRLAHMDASGTDTGDLLDEIRATIRIFDSLLEIARAEAARGEPRPLVPLDLSALTAEVCELYDPVAETRGIAFATDIAPGAQILGDRNMIAQLLSNLLENALKFTPPGEKVNVALTPSGTRHLLRVADTGPGLPPGFETRVFDRFSRASPDPAIPGHGLGLALVQAVALRHGAKLSLPPVQKGFLIEIAWPKVAPGQ